MLRHSAVALILSLVVYGALAGDLFRYSVASTPILVMGFILGFQPQGGVVDVLLAVALVLVFRLCPSPGSGSSWACWSGRRSP